MLNLKSLAAAACCLIHQPVTAGDSIFAVDSSWETISGNHNIVEGIAAASDGTVYVTDVLDDELIRLNPDGSETIIDQATGHANGLATGPDGRLYSVCMMEPRVLIWDLTSGKRESIPLPTPGNDLAITADGRLFYTWGKTNAVYELNLSTREAAKVADVENPNGISLNKKGDELLVGRFSSDTVLAFPILSEKGLGASREAFKVKTPKNGKGMIDGMTPFGDGKILASTALGLQILSPDEDPVVLENPTKQRANYVRFVRDAGGKSWIYASYVKSVLRRAARSIP